MEFFFFFFSAVETLPARAAVSVLGLAPSALCCAELARRALMFLL